jgi:hypothetical protein
MTPPDRSPLEAAHATAPALTLAGLWVTGEDRLRLTTFNSAAGVTLAIEGRAFLAEHGLRAFAERHVPTTDRTSTSTSFAIGEGWLLDVQIRASSGTPRRGQCLAILELVRGGEGGAVQPLTVLVHGYITDTQRRAWPGSPREFSTEGPGVIQSITGTDPAAGVEISETVPTNARWRFLAARFVLVTNATVANRSVTWNADDGAALFYTGASHDVQAASQTLTYCAGPGFVAARAPAALNVEIPVPVHLVLAGGFRLRTVTGNLQAGDNYGAPQLLVEEWIED